MCCISYEKDKSFHFINAFIDWISHLFFCLGELNVRQDAFKSHNARKRTPIFYQLASLESTNQHKGHLADHLFLCFTKYSSAVHLLLTPKHPEIQNSPANRTDTNLPLPGLISGLACLPKNLLSRCFAKGAGTVSARVQSFKQPGPDGLHIRDGGGGAWAAWLVRSDPTHPPAITWLETNLNVRRDRSVLF